MVPLPMLEPRGAVRADLLVDGQRLRVVGMHLDLSGLRRRQQLRTILAHLRRAAARHCPTVLMGDFNEWALHGGALREFHAPWRVLAPGAAFPSRRPVAQLDRIVVSAEWQVVERRGVHHSALAARGIGPPAGLGAAGAAQNIGTCAIDERAAAPAAQRHSPQSLNHRHFPNWHAPCCMERSRHWAGVATGDRHEIHHRHHQAVQARRSARSAQRARAWRA